MSPRRALPAGIRGRGSVFTYTWRDGAGRQYSRKVGDTLAQAEAFKRRIDDQLALGTYTPTSTMTFAAYATGWIETWPLKDQTRERYRGILRRELLPQFGGYPLAKIHPHQVRAWVHEQNAGPLSASSVRQHIAVLRSCLKAAQIDGHLGELPLLGVKMPRSYSRQPAVLTLTEAFAMIDAAPAAWQCSIASALFTGLRLGELLALTVDDVDLPGRRLNVRATLTEVNARTPRLKREEPKSRAGFRQVPIVEALAARLETHLAQLGSTDQGAVFASPVGTWMSKSNFYRDAWRPTRTAAGREDFTFHDLPHRRQPAARALRRRARRAEVRPGSQPDRPHRRSVRPPRPRPSGGLARDVRRGGQRGAAAVGTDPAGRSGAAAPAATGDLRAVRPAGWRRRAAPRAAGGGSGSAGRSARRAGSRPAPPRTPAPG